VITRGEAGGVTSTWITNSASFCIFRARKPVGVYVALRVGRPLARAGGDDDER
jgi:hypothetical protein